MLGSLLIIIICVFAVPSILFFTIKRYLTNARQKALLFQILNSIAVGFLVISLLLSLIRTIDNIPNLSILFLTFRYLALFIQRILITIITPEIWKYTPQKIEQWYHAGEKNPNRYHILFAISAYLSASIIFEISAWLLALYKYHEGINQANIVYIFIYFILSIGAVYLLSYQPWRTQKFPGLFKEAIASARYDILISALIVSTFFAYDATASEAALLYISVGITLSKLVRYWDTGLWLYKKNWYSSIVSYFQPVAIIIMAFGFLLLP